MAKPQRTKTGDDFSDYEIGLVKLLLSLGFRQEDLRIFFGTSKMFINQVATGDKHEAIPALELWSRNLTGGLHERVTKQNLKEGSDDPYAIYKRAGK